MTDTEVIQMMRKHYEALFPMECPTCHRRFATLREYIAGTERVGVGHDYDAEIGNWNPTKPIGGIAMANCSCGTTLTLGTGTMPLPLYNAALRWLKGETERRGVTLTQLLEHVRNEVRRQVLEEP